MAGGDGRAGPRWWPATSGCRGDDHDFGELTDDVRAFLADKLDELTDEELPDRGIEEVSMSKYRTGIGLLVADAPGEATRLVADCFR